MYAKTTTHSFALLIIDIINDFTFKHGEILSEKTKRIVPSIKNLKQKLKAKNIPVIYINDHYQLWQANLDTIITYCSNEKSKEILEAILPEKDDYFLIKPKHSAFYGTALHTLLNQLQVNSLIITGIAGNICVLFTANDAYMREYQLFIPSDCITSVSNEDNQYSLEMMKNVLKANTFPSTNHFYKQL